MFSLNQITPGSLVALIGGRGHFVTLRGDGAFVRLDTRTEVPVDADTVFASRANVTSAMIRKGSGTLTGSSVSLAGLDLDPKRTYVDFRSAIKYATVFDDVDDRTKRALISNVVSFYGLDGDK